MTDQLTENPFEKLPRDILLLIVGFTPDLPSLWNFSKSSPAIGFLLDDVGAEILESVLRNSLPYQVQAIIRIVALIRSSSIPCRTLDEFIQICKLENASSVPLLSRGTSPTVVRSLLASAHQIYLLTHSCLQHLISRCLAMQPSHLVDINFSYPLALPRQPWKQRPEGRRYQPRNSGPPSWIEEQRMLRAFWRVQVFYDLKNASAQSGLDWPEEDIGRLERMGIKEFYSSLAVEVEQINTAVDYIEELSHAGAAEHLSSGSTAPCLPLPWPSQEVKVDWSSPEPFFDYTHDDKLQQSAQYLHRTPPGCLITTLLANDPRSPIWYVTFESFRRYGLAIWDLKRLHALELMKPPYGHFILNHPGDLAFTWRSILREEEVAELESRNEERTRIRPGGMRPRLRYGRHEREATRIYELLSGNYS